MILPSFNSLSKPCTCQRRAVGTNTGTEEWNVPERGGGSPALGPHRSRSRPWVWGKGCYLWRLEQSLDFQGL